MVWWGAKATKEILKNREHRWFKYREDSYWHACKCERNRYINMFKFKKTHGQHQLVKQNSTDTKMLFKLINELAGNKEQNSLPGAKSDKDLAEGFAQFFLKQIEKIREPFEFSPTYHIHNKDMPKLDNFTTMSETTLYKLIIEMPTKSCEIHTIPTKLLKKDFKHCIPL